jgi:hypothetical protein
MTLFMASSTGWQLPWATSGAAPIIESPIMNIATDPVILSVSFSQGEATGKTATE